jgi:hypothetical protein
VAVESVRADTFVEPAALEDRERVEQRVWVAGAAVPLRRALRSVQAALVASAPTVPLGAALLTVAAYLAPAQLALGEPLTFYAAPLVPAFADLVVAWVALTLGCLVLGCASPDRVNGDSYEGLRLRLVDLAERCRSLGAPARGDPAVEHARHVAEVHRRHVAQALREPGPGWVLGSTYLALWGRLCSAEEALVLVDSKSRVIGDGLYDIARLAGSTIDDRSDLARRASNAIAVLGRGTPSHDLPLGPTDEAGAREDLQFVRRTIDDFRHQRWAGLIRARNRLGVVTGLTGLAMYALLWLAVAQGVARETIGIATTYYLIGSVVGFLSHLHGEANRPAAPIVDDYGLSVARLVVTPLLSGLAAVGGVVIVALLSLTQTGSTGALESQPLVRFLDLGTHPLNVLVAATFGLAPGQLISRLRQQTDEYNADLQKSRATDRQPPSAGAAPAA